METIVIESITLADGLTILSNKNVVTEVEIVEAGTPEPEKEAPVVRELNLSDNGDGTLALSLTTTDQDEALTDLSVSVVDSKGNVLLNEEIDLEQLTLTTTIDMLDIYASAFTVEVTGSCVLNGKISFTDHVMKSLTIEPDLRIDVNAKEQEAILIEKGTSIELVYDIKTNTGKEIEYLIINNIKVAVDSQDGAVYTVSLDPSTDGLGGIKELVLSQIFLEGNTQYVVEGPTIRVEIYKDVPSLENPSIIEDISAGNATITFDLVDIDEALEAGKVTLTKEAGKPEVIAENLEAGENTITFDVEQYIEYELCVLVDYKRNVDGEMIENETLYSVDLYFLEDYKVEVWDTVYRNLDGEIISAVNKGEVFTFEFKANNVTESDLVKIIINDEEYEIINLGEDAFKITSTDNSGQEKCTNVYEVGSATGVSSVTETNDITVVEREELDEEFFKEEMKLSAEIWNFETVEMLGYPTLK